MNQAIKDALMKDGWEIVFPGEVLAIRRRPDGKGWDILTPPCDAALGKGAN